VVDDHALHEGDIARRVAGVRERDRLLAIDDAGRLARCAGQDDGHFVGSKDRSGRCQQDSGERKTSDHIVSPFWISGANG
jgi:hypothetical protein